MARRGTARVRFSVWNPRGELRLSTWPVRRLLVNAFSSPVCLVIHQSPSSAEVMAAYRARVEWAGRR
jgi:hypothetical protein